MPSYFTVGNKGLSSYTDTSYGFIAEFLNVLLGFCPTSISFMASHVQMLSVLLFLGKIVAYQIGVFTLGQSRRVLSK